MAVRIPGINIDEYYQQLGPIEPLIRDDRVTEIMVNGADHVYVEMGGKVVLTNIKFPDEDQLLNVIQFIVRTVGRRIDERSPLCDARLADGSRVNAVIRPLALNGRGLPWQQPRPQRTRYGARNLILQRKEIFVGAIEALGPLRTAVLGVDELGTNPHQIA